MESWNGNQSTNQPAMFKCMGMNNNGKTSFQMFRNIEYLPVQWL